MQKSDEAVVHSLAAELGVSSLLARCIANRGHTRPEWAGHFIEPKLAHLQDPFLIPNMGQAVDRLFRAHQAKERIVVFGDYDVDGVTSSTLLTEFLRYFGWAVDCYLPHRIEEGYGLSSDGVRNCLDRYKPTLLLAVDCGSTSYAVIEELRALGVEVIVVDHHQPSDPPPGALALVNPHLGTDLEAKYLCSVGLAFKLAHALLKRCRQFSWPNADTYDLREFLDLVALGTVADIVPLRGENRIFVRAGLERIHSTKRAGLIALKKVAGIAGTIGTFEVGYQLGPRLNAAGRLETAQAALDLLLTKDASHAENLARMLDEQNRQRQGLEKKITEEALAAVRARFDAEKDFIIVEGNANWHLGVVGIVASRILREFHRPVIIFGSDGSEVWRGSGRSIGGFNLAAGLRECSDLLIKSGGHAMAAGMTMESSKIQQFQRKMNEIVRDSIKLEDMQPSLDIDGEVPLSEVSFEELKSLLRLQPVGQGNPPVQLVSRNLHLKGQARCVGKHDQHRRFCVTDGTATHQAIWWNCDPKIQLPARFNLAYAPEFKEFNGTYGIQLKVLDLQPV